MGKTYISPIADRSTENLAIKTRRGCLPLE